MKRRRNGIVLALILLLLTGCGQREAYPSAQNSEARVYYLTAEEDSLTAESAEAELFAAGQIEQVLTRMQEIPDKAEYKSVFSDRVQLRTRNLEDGHLTLDFSASYRNLTATEEVLTRAAVVRTLVQLPDVGDVAFTVEGVPLAARSGEPIGRMTADSFVENAGRQINAYQHAAINLYFANKDGTALRRESRSIYYSSNKPLEWAVTERLIAGPKVENNYAAVPAATHILSVSSSGGICYVNLDSAFLSEMPGVDGRVTVYSIVNSLVEDCGVTEVQISVEGETSLIYRGAVDLSVPIYADLSLVEEAS